jgi:muramoyltetrapeptide carboxypeptidase
LSSVVKPRALHAGDRIGICAPAGPVDLERLQRGAAELRALGFDVLVPEGIGARTAFTAGSIERRLAELHRLFADDSVAGIVCARGGAGAGWLLERLDADLLRSHPKPFVGYSDVTFLHLYFARLGMASVHGPMAAWELADGSYDKASFRHALTGEGTPYASEPDDLEPLRKGEAEGVLRGGCLSILAAASGTPWALDTKRSDTILFLEDVDERPFRLDRMLLQLRASGAFDGVRGVVFGDMRGCSPKIQEDHRLEDVLLQALDGLDVPIALGLSSGHAAGPAVTLPLGVRARLFCGGEEARFDVLEPGVA